MVDDKEEKTDTGFTQIKPAAIKLSSKNKTTEFAAWKFKFTKNIFLLLSFSLLFISVAIVIVYLPEFASRPEIKTINVEPSKKVAQDTPPPNRTPQATVDSPWEKAQQSKLRKETQEILSQLLDAQKSLTESGVTKWAADDFAKAIDYAESGDDFYNKRDFLQARNAYQQAQFIFTELIDKVDAVFAATMASGNKALAEGNATEAMAAFQLALSIDTLDRAANIGLERAEKLDDVMALIAQGDNLLAEGKLQQARLVYQQALTLDSHMERAQRQIQRVDQKILDKEFNQFMSAGFNALEKSNYEQARQSFNNALRLKPKSAEVGSAINQVNQRITTFRINALLAEGKRQEENERWHDALKQYTAALALDANLQAAIAGKKRSTLRATIHEKLEQIFVNAERLYEPAVYEETVNFHEKLRAVNDPGAVLTKQMITLTTLLSKANTPVTVMLKSDNQTTVTLHKVGKLGQFTDKELSLRPGRYVAVGHREGYRDSRVEFLLEPDKPERSIVIQAGEKIALGR